MAPDRGSRLSISPSITDQEAAMSDGYAEECNASKPVVGNPGTEETTLSDQAHHRIDTRNFLTERASQGQHFTVRGIVVGLVIGVVICFSNMYFGLQTGWISGMAMPSALIGFAFFKTVARYINYPFTTVENVLVQSVAGSVGTMPLGCGFVGVIPALEFMLRPEENGPLALGIGKLMIWALGLCFFGVFFAVPLRKEVIIREKLKFPSGTATALMIGVLHGNRDDDSLTRQNSAVGTIRRSEGAPRHISMSHSHEETCTTRNPQTAEASEQGLESNDRSDWRAQIGLLMIAFTASAAYTLTSYFFPQIRSVPLFGFSLAEHWLIRFNPSPAYIGQGVIMGPQTCLSMLFGAVIGWGVLSPLAKTKGWAPGPVEDWETGSKGWIVWVSLAIMLVDSIISLGWLTLRPTLIYGPHYIGEIRDRVRRGKWTELLHLGPPKNGWYGALANTEPIPDGQDKDVSDEDAPPEQLVNNRVVIFGFIVSIVICIAAVRTVFGALVPTYSTVIAVLAALLLSIMGVRALGETDLNPVSGISKLTQLFFALIIPSSNENAVIINLVAGAISESGAIQAGDLMQDLKAGHILGAAPKAQFYGQLIGSALGAIVSAGVYKLYTKVYNIPGGVFQVPTGYVWVYTARLVTGKGLPYMAWQWSAGAGILFAVLTALRIAGQGKVWRPWIPAGIAVAVGMYNTIDFTLGRTVGGLLSWYWQSYRKREESPVVILASGLILGEGVCSIINLTLASFDVPHL